MNNKLYFARFFLTSGLLITACAASAATYSITDLGTLTSAYGINDSGQVVGTVGSHAFIYSGGVTTDIGTLPGGTTSIGLGINSSGQAVGYSNTSTFQKSFLYSGGTMSALGTLPGGVDSYAQSINDSGQVAGSAVSASGNLHATLQNMGGNVTDLGTLGGLGSAAYAINTSGQVVGDSEIDPSAPAITHAFIYSGGVMSDLGTLAGATFSKAYAINNNGQVAGYSGHAFLYSAGVMNDLGVLLAGSYSQAWGLNDSGQVVGTAGVGIDVTHAFIYNGGVLSDLNSLIAPDSGWDLQEARDINNAGQIVGWGIVGGNTSVRHAFLLTAVPIPATAWLFSSGLLGLIGFARRKAA